MFNIPYAVGINNRVHGCGCGVYAQLGVVNICIGTGFSVLELGDVKVHYHWMKL